MKKDIGTPERLYPNPVVLVSSSFNNIDNIITLAWVGTVCSNPPLVSISIRPSRYSYDLIKKSGEFVINIPDNSQVDICEFCGTKSGKDVDKFKSLGLTKDKSNHMAAPLIRECKINMECKVKQSISLGTHDLFIAEIVCVNADEDIVYEDGDLDFEKLRIISHSLGKYFNNDII